MNTYVLESRKYKNRAVYIFTKIISIFLHGFCHRARITGRCRSEEEEEKRRKRRPYLDTVDFFFAAAAIIAPDKQEVSDFCTIENGLRSMVSNCERY